MQTKEVAIIAVTLSLGLSRLGHAQTQAALDGCHNKASTMSIVECLDGLTKQADRRLNAGYQKALKSVDPSGVPALRAAERAWLEYRKQRCSYVSAGSGTIVQILGADCMAQMTKARADELEQDSKGLGE